MEIFVTFPDGTEKKFEKANQVSKEIGISQPIVSNALKIGKKVLVRKRDNQEFRIRCKSFPKVVISDGEKEFSFSSFKDAKEFFELP